MARPQAYVTNLELRDSNPDGSEGAGLSHTAGGMFLLHVLEFASYGEPRGCVTVLHDAGDHGGRYEEFAHVLAADGWAVALPDMRGHGRSEGERGHSWGWLEVTRDLDAILGHLAYQLPGGRQVLIGQGLGALQACAYAIEKPGRVAALVLLAPLLEPRFELPERKGLRGMFRRVGPTSAGSLGYAPERRSSDLDTRRALAADGLMHDVVTVRAGEMAAAAAERVRSGMSGLTTPTLILQGSADAIADPSRARALAGGAVEVRTIERAGHDLAHEHGAAAVMEAVREWIGGQVPLGA